MQAWSFLLLLTMLSTALAAGAVIFGWVSPSGRAPLRLPGRVGLLAGALFLALSAWLHRGEHGPSSGDPQGWGGYLAAHPTHLALAALLVLLALLLRARPAPTDPS